MASLNTSRPRSSRPGMDSPQEMKSTLSAMPTPFVFDPVGGPASGSVRRTLSEVGHRVHELLHGGRRLLQLLLLVRVEVEVDDLLHALLAEPHRHAHEEVVDAELALAERGAGEHALLVED